MEASSPAAMNALASCDFGIEGFLGVYGGGFAEFRIYLFRVPDYGFFLYIYIYTHTYPEKVGLFRYR